MTTTEAAGEQQQPKITIKYPKPMNNQQTTNNKINEALLNVHKHSWTTNQQENMNKTVQQNDRHKLEINKAHGKRRARPGQDMQC